MDSWKGCFLKKLQDVQSKCAQKFEEVLEGAIIPVYSDLSAFLADNGFEVSTPLSDPGHRSFKFELAENAYFLIIFRFTGVDEFELRTETLAPGSEPVLEKHTGRMSDMRKEWARSLFQVGLERFVDLLGGQKAENSKEAVAAV